MSQYSQSTISSQAIQEIEDIYLCPVTLQLMKQPYTIQCGHTFERNAIKSHLEKQPQCPLCRKEVTFEKGVRNLIAQQGIQMLKKHIERKALKKKSICIFIRYHKTYPKYLDSKATLNDLYLECGKIVERDQTQFMWEFKVIHAGKYLSWLKPETPISSLLSHESTVTLWPSQTKFGTKAGEYPTCKVCSLNQKHEH